MPFTTPALIKAHLLTAAFPQLTIEDYLLTLSGTAAVPLPHHNLEGGSLTVKWLGPGGIARDGAITLEDYDAQPLSHGLIARDSVVAALSDSLATVYTADIDFAVDRFAGSIRRLPGTAIPDRQAVLVFYRRYITFAPGTDYTVDLAAGTVARTASSAIPDGATVLLDYTVAAGSVEDDLIALAIAEAQDLIARFLSPEFSEHSTDQGLATGATQLALAIICRAQAIECLSRRVSADAPGRAKEWQQLSRAYEQQAHATLAPFLLPLSLRSTFRLSREA